MFVTKTLVAAFVSVAVSLLPSTQALSVTSPNSNAYWVWGTSNIISWTYSTGDPSAVSIFITNPNSAILNGPFAIAENVPIGQESITVTDVTLRPDDGYIVNFVDTSNTTDNVAQSPGFTVKPQGSLPYGATVVVSTSFTVSGSVTEGFPITFTSSSGQTFATGFVTPNATGSAATQTSTEEAGPATATIINKHSSGSAAGTYASGSSTGAILMGVWGVLLGAITVL